jgi:hypothetical protein
MHEQDHQGVGQRERQGAELAEGVVEDDRDVHDLPDVVSVPPGPGLMVVARPARCPEEGVMPGEELLEGGPIGLIHPLKQLSERKVGTGHRTILLCRKPLCKRRGRGNLRVTRFPTPLTPQGACSHDYHDHDHERDRPHRHPAGLILATDLGKYKSVACAYTGSPDTAAFDSLTTDRGR